MVPESSTAIMSLPCSIGPWLEIWMTRCPLLSNSCANGIVNVSSFTLVNQFSTILLFIPLFPLALYNFRHPYLRRLVGIGLLYELLEAWCHVWVYNDRRQAWIAPLVECNVETLEHFKKELKRYRLTFGVNNIPRFLGDFIDHLIVIPCLLAPKLAAFLDDEL